MPEPASLSFLIIESSSRARAELRRSIGNCGIHAHMVLEAITAGDALTIASAISVDVVLLDPDTLDLPADDFIKKLLQLPRSRRMTIILIEKRGLTPTPEWSIAGMLRRPVTGPPLRTLLLKNALTTAAPALDVTPPDHFPACNLTPREQEVLKFVAEGKSSREIASMLFITTKTVVWHRQSIMNKLGLRTVAELTKYAIGRGITSL